ncbi:hypothetical protein OG897_03990 [Streptomyces sp. NBC_00237]|uniref:hypothetical protein n=1 Tax=Streptomyces sp. NBC_00237 TaxID=2975687 RepID=UPI002252D5C2|nr:hypothetical protein [Streptomyces sp. NBC_00237]MCX5200626.1 hypothetical protein [Streptomyces sp. NBC_00237]
MSVLHRLKVHEDAQCLSTLGECDNEGCPAVVITDAAIGSMTFFRVHPAAAFLLT